MEPDAITCITEGRTIDATKRNRELDGWHGEITHWVPMPPRKPR